MFKRFLGLCKKPGWLNILGGIGFLTVAHGAVTANNDFYTNPAGTALNVAAPGVLANDAGTGLTALLVQGPQHGILALSTNGSFIYSPTNQFAGVDGFTYKAVSGSSSSTATAVIMVLAPGQLFYDSFERPANGHGIFPWISSTNFQIVGSWGITNKELIGFSASNNYALAYIGNAGWTDYSVQAQIRFSADNAASAAIFGRLDADSGARYSAWIYPEHSTEFLASGNGTAVLHLIKYDNWTWPYTVMDSGVPLPGAGAGWHNLKMTFQGNSISVFFDGKLVESAADDGSVDSYPVLTNGGIGANVWTLSPSYAFSLANMIVSTTNAVANPDSYNAVSNKTLNVAAPGILANDSGSGNLNAMLVGGPFNGSLVLGTNGAFSYTPAAGFAGLDTFTYECVDGQSTSAVATVTLRVGNFAVAYDNAYAVSKPGAVLNVSARGVLANDLGGSGTLTAQLITGPADGKLTFTNNGGFRYAAVNLVGTDSFTYVAQNSHATSAVAVVSLVLDPGPIISNGFYSTSQGQPLTVAAPGVLQNVVSGPGGPSAVILASRPRHGILNWGGDGSFMYQPTNNYTGMDSFNYEASDGLATSTVAPVEIMIKPPQVLFYDNFARASAGSNSITPWIQASGLSGITNGVFFLTSARNNYGAAYSGDSNWTDYAVQAQVRFSKTNGWGGGIGGRLNPATGSGYALWVYPEGSAGSGLPPGTPAMEIIKFESWTAYTSSSPIRLPSVGTKWHGIKLAFQGTNIAGFFDGRQITNFVDDGTWDGQPAFASGGISLDMFSTSVAYALSISNVTVTPLVFNGNYSVKKNVTLSVPGPGVLTNDTDVYGTNLNASLITAPTNGALNLNTNGGFTYTPSVNFQGTDTFVFLAHDVSNNLGIATGTVVVLPGTNLLTVAVNNASRFYGATNPAFTVSYSGFANGDSPSVLRGTPLINTTAKSNSPVGVYPVSISAGNLMATNYWLRFSNGVLSINPAPLAVAANNQTRMYSLPNPALTATFSGFVNNEKTNALAGAPALSTSATSGSAPGNYPINAAVGSLSATNYNFVFQGGTLTVTPAPTPVIASFALNNQTLAMSWSSVTGALYGLEESTNLSGSGSGSGSGWTLISSNFAAGLITAQTNVVGSLPECFFRIQILPQ